MFAFKRIPQEVNSDSCKHASVLWGDLHDVPSAFGPSWWGSPGIAPSQLSLGTFRASFLLRGTSKRQARKSLVRLCWFCRRCFRDFSWALESAIELVLSQSAGIHGASAFISSLKEPSFCIKCQVNCVYVYAVA